jgi:riboflavin kinase / FMN adenylyltransferase
LRQNMHIFRDTRQLPAVLRGAALALGNFDGVHRGHATLIARTRALSPVVGVLTFSPHPRLITQPDLPPFLLTSSEAKMAILEKLGVDFCIELPFTAALAAMAAEDFVADILAARLGARHLVFGHDFRFGQKRKGDVDLLRRLEYRHGFTVNPVAPVTDESGRLFSSSLIRDRLRAGDVDGAARSLGRAWSIHIPAYAFTAHDDGRATIVFRFGNHVRPAAGSYAVRVGGGSNAEAVLRLSGDDDLGRLQVPDAGAIHGEPITLEFVRFLGKDADPAEWELSRDAARVPALSGPTQAHFAQARP